MLRYNTGTDKKAFIKYRKEFDAVIFNSTIVAYSGASVADLVSMYANKYIIDPQTHIFQQELSALSSNKNQLKKSVEKYLKALPEELSNPIINEKRMVGLSDLMENLDMLVKKVYEFQANYVNGFIKKKEYEKYLVYSDVKPEPRMFVAPYFMLKDKYSYEECVDWIDLNIAALHSMVAENMNNQSTIKVAAQIVLERRTLENDEIINYLIRAYDQPGYEYVFIWIDNFNSFESEIELNKAFSFLIKRLNDIGKKPLMAYGGYDSILLCNEKSPYKMYGVAQSVGYGEYRSITPVGGGIPINKYYFKPLHKRMKFDEVAQILLNNGFFTDEDKSSMAHLFYNDICSCETCKGIIKDNIDNFNKYNGLTSYVMMTKNGPSERNRATNEALLLAAFHFLACKVDEWNLIVKYDYDELLDLLKKAYKKYLSEMASSIDNWCEVYGS